MDKKAFLAVSTLALGGFIFLTNNTVRTSSDLQKPIESPEIVAVKANDSKEQQPERRPLGQIAYNLSKQKVGGFEFYLGYIKNDSGLESRADYSEKVASVLKEVRFPKSLASNTTFIFYENELPARKILFRLDEKTSAEIALDSSTFHSKQARYVRTPTKNPVIFIGNWQVKSKTNDLVETLLHELGHRIVDELSEADWGEYFTIRRIPAKTYIYQKPWALSPDEDLAEVYRYFVSKNYIDESPEPIQTYYGLLEATHIESLCQGHLTDALKEGKSASEAEKDYRVQSCRQKALLNHGERTSAKPYKSIFSTQEEAFMRNILARFK